MDPEIQYIFILMLLLAIFCPINISYLVILTGGSDGSGGSGEVSLLPPLLWRPEERLISTQPRDLGTVKELENIFR